jgi:hypothetical protein
VLAAWLVLAAAGISGAQENADAPSAVHVALSPDTLRVAPGESFTLELRIDAPGKRFNGYDAIVAFDTNAVACVTSGQVGSDEGDLMKNACGNTFHRFSVRGDSASIAHVILCSGVSLSGPGTLHRLRFRALDLVGSTTIRLRRVQFYSAGMFVNPAWTRDAVVIVSGKAQSHDRAVGLCIPRTAPAAALQFDAAEYFSARWRWQG